MRFKTFARPDEDNPIESASADGAGSYALRAFQEPQESSKGIERETFVKSLTDLLTSAAASSAPQRDRSLKNLQSKLTSDGFDRRRYLEVVRDVINKHYLTTWLQINQIGTQRAGHLPIANFPALSLPLAGTAISTAEKFVVQLHAPPEPRASTGSVSSRIRGVWRGTSKRDKQPFSFLTSIPNILKEDPDGYSAMLCAALGYIAQGNTWLEAAAALANTAVTFALAEETNNDSAPNPQYPEGNEALYLSAFISRMLVDAAPGSHRHAQDWFTKHMELMTKAEERLALWRERNRELADRKLLKAENSKPTESADSIGDMIGLRYDAERHAGSVFAMLIDRLNPSSEPLWNHAALDLAYKTLATLERWMSIPLDRVEPVYRPDVQFTGAQLAVAAFQAWICAKEQLQSDKAVDGIGSLDPIERRLEVWANKCMKPLPQSKLLIILAEIFAIHALKLRKGCFHVMDADFEKLLFARLDTLRTCYLHQLCYLIQDQAFVSAGQNNRGVVSF